MNLIDKLFKKTENTEETYLEETIARPISLDIDSDFADGTVKIDSKLFYAAKAAMETRIEANKAFTRARVDRINTNWKLYEADETGEEKVSDSSIVLPEIPASVEDYVDDFIAMVTGIEDFFDIDTTQVEDMRPENLQYVDKDIDEQFATNDKLASSVLAQAKNEILSAGGEMEKQNHYFEKVQINRDYIRTLLIKSGFLERAEDFFRQGTISGEFWGKLSVTKKDRYAMESFITGEEINHEDIPFAFRVDFPDARNIICPKNRRWVIERINEVPFSELLVHSIDNDGKQKKSGGLYDSKVMAFVANELKEGRLSKESKNELFDIEEIDLDAAFEVDKAVTVYEGHNIPLPIGKEIFMSKIIAINVGDADNLFLMPISILKTPYTLGVPYLYSYFAPGNDGKAIGLPQLLEPAARLLNKFFNLAAKIAEFGLKGVKVVLAGAFEDRDALNELRAGETLRIKDFGKGLSIDQCVKWLFPPVEILQNFGFFVQTLQGYIRRITRNRAGEKITPNPTATEASNIIEESNKTITKVGNRIERDILNPLLRSLYAYSLSLSGEKITVKTKGYVINNPSDPTTININESEDQLNPVTCTISLKKEDMILKGLDFRIKMTENYAVKAVMRSQGMQFLKVLTETGFIRDQNGMPVSFKDEEGSDVQVSQFKLIKALQEFFNQDVLVRIKAPQQAPQMQLPPGTDPAMMQPMLSGPSIDTAAENIPNILNSTINSAAGGGLR